MFKRWLPAALCIALLAAPLPAAATDYTDIWYIAKEAGWGVNLVQADDVLFVTFFIYGPNNQPTWFVAIMSRDSNGNFAGNLFSTVGPYFGGPWDPALYSPTLAGTASFVPASPYTGTLRYTPINGPNVEKSIERQTLQTIALGANYIGGQTGTYTSCTDGSLNGSYNDTYNLSVTHANGVATLIFYYNAVAATCTMAGTLDQRGQLYRIAPASYSCTGDLQVNATATMEEIKATAQGIEGRFSANLNNGCQESAQFSAVLY
jgi:hypothetical protein